MSQNFQSAARMLYAEFGDIGVEFVRTKGINFLRDQIATQLGAKNPHEGRPTATNADATNQAIYNTDGNAAGSGAETPAENQAIEDSINASQHSGDKHRDELNGENASYKDAEGFAATVENHVDNLGVKSIQSPADVVAAVEDLILMAGEVRKFEELQITQRMDIAAGRDVAIANIKARTKILEDYLNRSFDERAENFSKLFDVVDDALDTNNMQALALGLNSVVELAASSPFKNLSSVKEATAALTDPNHEWDF